MSYRPLVIATIFALLGALAFAPRHAAAAEEYVLPYIATGNAPAGADGVMRIAVENGKSIVRLEVRRLYPDTVYTIWTAFNHLAPGMETGVTAGADGKTVVLHAPSSCSANGRASHPLCPGGWAGWHGFHREGNGVAPTASVGARFTDGMGLDPGATFVTDSRGHGQVTVELDFDITREAPVGNKDIIVQCAPVPGVIFTADANGKIEKACADSGSKLLRVTSTWVREFIGQIPHAQRATACANYERTADPDNFVAGTPKHAQALAEDARLWQCVDPRTGMPRVARFGFDHFRLANHVDDLTHGFIGGNTFDHIIDMVGMRACAVPPLPPLPAAGGLTIDYTCPVPAAKNGKGDD